MNLHKNPHCIHYLELKIRRIESLVKFLFSFFFCSLNVFHLVNLEFVREVFFFDLRQKNYFLNRYLYIQWITMRYLRFIVGNLTGK